MTEFKKYWDTTTTNKSTCKTMATKKMNQGGSIEGITKKNEASFKANLAKQADDYAAANPRSKKTAGGPNKILAAYKAVRPPRKSTAKKTPKYVPRHKK